MERWVGLFFSPLQRVELESPDLKGNLLTLRLMTLLRGPFDVGNGVQVRRVVVGWGWSGTDAG